MEEKINQLMEFSGMVAYLIACVIFWGGIICGLVYGSYHALIYVRMQKKKGVNGTKSKNGKTKDLGTHILVCVLLCVSFLSMIGLAYETQIILTQKTQIVKSEIRILDLKGALIITELRIKWLKRQMRKPLEEKIPGFRSI